MSDEIWTAELVQKNIDDFLDGLLLKDGDATVVGVLRFGAHLPHLWSRTAGEMPQRVDLVLSHMMEFLPRAFYEKHRFVILDDTVYEGRQMQKHLERLQALGVDRSRITTAAVVVRSRTAKSDRPDVYGQVLDDIQYAQWKSALSALVRAQRRSVDRDHPLYFFHLLPPRSARFIAVLENFGEVSQVRSHSYGNVRSFSVTIDSAVMAEYIAGLDGLTFAEFCKIRFYWIEEKDRLRLTVVPIVFVRADLSRFLADDGVKFEALTGIPLAALSYLVGDRAAYYRYVYYLLSRTLASCLLEKFVRDALPALRSEQIVLAPLEPIDQDRPVSYVFPQTYNAFYDRRFKKLQELIDDERPANTQPRLDFGWPYDCLQTQRRLGLDISTGMERKFQLLELLTRERDCVEFDGRTWIARPVPGKAVSALVRELKDPLLVSRSLDEFLDAGLLKAEDAMVLPDPVFERVMAPGGEFNARTVSLLSDAVRCGSRAVSADLGCVFVGFKGWQPDDEF